MNQSSTATTDHSESSPFRRGSENQHAPNHDSMTHSNHSDSNEDLSVLAAKQQKLSKLYMDNVPSHVYPEGTLYYNSASTNFQGAANTNTAGPIRKQSTSPILTASNMLAPNTQNMRIAAQDAAFDSLTNAPNQMPHQSMINNRQSSNNGTLMLKRSSSQQQTNESQLTASTSATPHHNYSSPTLLYPPPPPSSSSSSSQSIQNMYSNTSGGSNSGNPMTSSTTTPTSSSSAYNHHHGSSPYHHHHHHHHSQHHHEMPSPSDPYEMVHSSSSSSEKLPSLHSLMEPPTHQSAADGIGASSKNNHSISVTRGSNSSAGMQQVPTHHHSHVSGGSTPFQHNHSQHGNTTSNHHHHNKRAPYASSMPHATTTQPVPYHVEPVHSYGSSNNNSKASSHHMDMFGHSPGVPVASSSHVQQNYPIRHSPYGETNSHMYPPGVVAASSSRKVRSGSGASMGARENETSQSSSYLFDHPGKVNNQKKKAKESTDDYNEDKKNWKKKRLFSLDEVTDLVAFVKQRSENQELARDVNYAIFKEYEKLQGERRRASVYRKKYVQLFERNLIAKDGTIDPSLFQEYDQRSYPKNSSKSYVSEDVPTKEESSKRKYDEESFSDSDDSLDEDKKGGTESPLHPSTSYKRPKAENNKKYMVEETTNFEESEKDSTPTRASSEIQQDPNITICVSLNGRNYLHILERETFKSIEQLFAHFKEQSNSSLRGLSATSSDESDQAPTDTIQLQTIDYYDNTFHEWIEVNSLSIQRVLGTNPIKLRLNTA
ncbi:hypothetical protein C9374_006655 [Naegleria lovaniensis]|uniref:Uncharacterized protein n=1 Tax=Naegleria lovaniensis TaxID=51637 RepID=A0AA88GNF5_NAELO|nr:uncharacterized protein C9374_006655 [Naegleria lovaniensis]KAG2379538.1 hypothetical protein C9374_006655 [Naegleria lovaniensis]